MDYLKTARHLKNIAEVCLANLIGTYTLPNGQILKAIAINPSMTNLVFPPPGTSIEGLECHIYYPEIKARSIISGSRWDLSWSVYLKQWDVKKTTIFAAEKFVAGCPYPVVNIFRNPPNLNINQPEICRIKINCHSVIY